LGGRAKIIVVNDGIIRKTYATVLEEQGSEMGAAEDGKSNRQVKRELLQPCF